MQKSLFSVMTLNALTETRCHQTTFNYVTDAENEDLREHFSDCGSIENVRIIRDKMSGMGKGFGYIKFEV